MKKWVLPTVFVVCISAIVLMIASLNISNKQSNKTFTPPEFDKNSISGMPDVPDDIGYSEIYKAGMSYKAYVCGEIAYKNGLADVYFTSDKENTILLKLRIFDEKNNIIAETGLIKGNEYIKSVTFNDTVKDGQNIKLKIMGYEKDTYYSAGSVTLNTTVTKED